MRPEPGHHCDTLAPRPLPRLVAPRLAGPYPLTIPPGNLLLLGCPHGGPPRPPENHFRHRGGGGGPGERPPRLPLRARARLREHRPGRRDQPRAAPHAGGAAGGDAGASRHRRRRDAAPPAAHIRAVHAEPDRAGGGVPAPRPRASARTPARGRSTSSPSRTRARTPGCWSDAAPSRASPRAALFEALGPPAAGEVPDEGPAARGLPVWAQPLLLALLLAEWASRRVSGAR